MFSGSENVEQTRELKIYPKVNTIRSITYVLLTQHVSMFINTRPYLCQIRKVLKYQNKLNLKSYVSKEGG